MWFVRFTGHPCFQEYRKIKYIKNVVKLFFIPNHIVTVLSSTCTPSSWKLIALLHQFLFSWFCICNCQFLVSFMTNIKVTIDMKNTAGKSARFLVFVLILSDFKYSYVKHLIKCMYCSTTKWRKRVNTKMMIWCVAHELICQLDGIILNIGFKWKGHEPWDMSNTLSRSLKG